MSRRVVILILILLIGLGGTVAWLTRTNAETLLTLPDFEEQGMFSYTASTDYWTQQLRLYGADSVGIQVEEIGSEMAPGPAHRLMHSFGDSLYNVFGLDGVISCSPNFLMGCFHQVIGRAVSDKGIAAIHDILEACDTGYSDATCLHGVGHGLLGALGYTQQSLHEAIAVCAKSDSPNSCFEGIFMEYNMRFFATTDFSGENTTRPFAYEAKYSPCLALSDTEAVFSCIYELPKWWAIEAGETMDEKELFRTMGDYCNDIGPDYINACFLGIGNTAVISLTHKNDAQVLCDEATTTNHSMTPYCYVGAAYATRYTDVFTADSADICTSFNLSPTWHNACTTYLTSLDRDPLY